MAMSCLADGTSYIRETIFDGRYMMADELNKMGAKIDVSDVAVVHGPTPLRGADVTAHDLRTGIALVLAGLAADGETMVSPGYLINRGHSAVAARLTALGADITEEPV
jgi:UDP-N-acetylglucosamine 1-carboxyvinyltransferase